MARIALIGGTGTISAHCVAALAGEGHQVTAIVRGTASRGPPPSGAKLMCADRDDPGALARALTAVTPEAVLDFACFTPDQALVLAGSLPASARQVILVSTVDVYGLPLPRLPMTEAEPWAVPASPYAAAKREAEDALAATLHGAATTVVRPTYSLGPGFVISPFSRDGRTMLARLRLGLPVPVPGAGETLIHPSDATDTGRMIAALTLRDAAFGRDYTVGTPDATMTHRAYVETIAAALGLQARLAEIDRAQLLAPGGLPADSLYLELTRRDLSYALDRVLHDLPGFCAKTDLATRVRAWAARHDPADDARLAGEGEGALVPATGRQGEL